MRASIRGASRTDRRSEAPRGPSRFASRVLHPDHVGPADVQPDYLALPA